MTTHSYHFSNSMKAIAILLCTLMLTTTITPARPTQKTYTPQPLTLTFDPTTLTTTTIDGYDILTFPDATTTSEPGAPHLPAQDLIIAVPATTTITAIQILHAATQQLPGTYTIPGNLPPQTTNDPTHQAFTAPTLSTTNPYPESPIRLLGQSDLYGQGLAYILFTPLQYNPATNTITATTSLTFQLTGTSGRTVGDLLPAATTSLQREQKTQDLQRLVINPDQVNLQQAPPHRTPTIPPGGPYSTVIITSTSDATAWQTLATWNTKRGIRTLIYTATQIYANYTGSTNQAKIRAFIIDAYTSWACSFFLLGGEIANVPGMTKTYTINGNPESVIGDQYYNDYDDDWTSEVNVGRVSATGSAQVALFTNKTIAYQCSPPMTNFATKALLQGMDLDESSPAETMKAAINTSYIPHPQFTVTTVYDSQSYTPTHKSKFITAINAGQNLVNHYDHSNEDVLGMGYINHYADLSSSEVDSVFTNTNLLCNIASAGCHPLDYSVEDNIAEHFVIYNANKCAVSFTGDSGYGWYNTGDPGAYTGELDTHWWQALFSNSKYTLGEMISWAKNLYGTPFFSVEKYCFYSFNLLGDPTMPVWTANPATLTVTHPATLPIGSSSFTVHVAQSGSPVNQALVCLWKGTQVYLTGLTNTNGDAVFAPAPTTIGFMNVTVTKHNYLPNMTSATVINTSNQPPVAVNDTATTPEDTPIWINVLANDYDPDGTIVVSSVTVVTPPTHGTTTVNTTTGYIRYAPQLNYHGADSFVYQITDNQGGVDTATVFVTITDVNDPPVASFTYEPAHPKVNDIVFLNSTSTDVDGTVVNWSWDFGDGAHGYGEHVTHTYTDVQTYHVILVVCDDDGATANTSTNIAVSPSAVVADAGGPYSGMAGVTIWFLGNATGGTPPYTYHWDFGDGNTSVQQNPQHVYNHHGLYTVQLQVEDSLSQEATDNTTAAVSNDTIAPSILLVTPQANMLYFFGLPLMPLSRTIVIGSLTVVVHAVDHETGMNRVELYVNGVLESTCTTGPDYQLAWETPAFGKRTLRAVAYDNAGNTNECSLTVLKIL